MKPLSIGIENFKELIDRQYYFVDKSDLISDLMKEKIVIYTRPRRFGKTLMLSMLYYFFSVCKRDNAYLFRHLGQFTRNYTQTVKRAADNKRRYAPGWVHSTCLLRGFPKGAAPHLAHDFAEQSVVCYTLCRRCPENTVAAGEGKGI